ncbi:hypothetical protein THRCLA_04018 [Thraustotheca clavata]|uniref:NAD-dependent epimerase/dehydratase domain-containing protein n=1 Tax=Thraustotheca clavata TaxID=74557 RepID=A0A1W0A077_9STRA|nr:hypothetical protein THRCLA_04018 [Thraustotheca clavata]
MTTSPIAFVTGASGFLGRNLIEALQHKGWQIIAMHRANSNIKHLKELGVECRSADMCDATSIAQVMPSQVDAVFHLAANTTFWKEWHDQQWRDNVDGTKSMCEAALGQRAKRFVFVSSTASYGYRDDILREDLEQKGSEAPINYFRSKAAAENEVRAAVARGLQAVIVNPAHIIGPYDQKGWVRIFRQVAEDKLTGIPPGGGAFCYAPFVAEAIISAAERGAVGQNYLLGGPEVSFLELIHEASRVLGKNETRKPLPPFLLRLVGRWNEFIAKFNHQEPELTYEGSLVVCMNIRIGSTKAQDELGYKTQAIEKSVKETIEWMQAQS